MMFGEHSITNTVCSLSLQAFLQLLCLKFFFENVIQPCRSVENQANSDLSLLSLNESRELIEN